MGLTADAYARMLKALLPPGRVWNVDAGGYLDRLCLALARELARVDGRAGALVEEADPRTATETLPEWERMLGLPDEDVIAIPDTTAKRRLAVTQKFIRRGGQNAAYFQRVAEACGYPGIEITDGYAATVARAGKARAGDRARGVTWAHLFTVTVPEPPGVALSEAELEAIIRRIAPAHTVAEFVFL